MVVLSRKPEQPSQSWVGIDVGKSKLDVCILRRLPLEESPAQNSGPIAKPGNKKSKKARLSGDLLMTEVSFDNNVDGWEQLRQAVQEVCPPEDNPHFCMESTGPYSQGVALFLARKDMKVSLVNPHRIKHHGRALNAGNKTDRADARLIADYCYRMKPAVWICPPDPKLDLRELNRTYLELQEARLREINRQETTPRTSVVSAQRKKRIELLEEQMEELQREMNDMINRDPDLQSDRDLLISIPGIADRGVQTFLSEVQMDDFDSAEQLASWSGTAPSETSSGTSVHGKTRMSGKGNVRLRSMFYMCALPAMRHNPLIRDLYHRLRARGLCAKAALLACARKLIMLCYGVLKNRKAFDPTWAAVKAA